MNSVNVVGKIEAIQLLINESLFVKGKDTKTNVRKKCVAPTPINVPFCSRVGYAVCIDCDASNTSFPLLNPNNYDAPGTYIEWFVLDL